MASIVLELQQEAMDSKIKVSDILRKALVVATKLEITEFKEWIEKELRGYSGESIPEYRKLRGEIKAFNPYQGWIPVILKDGKLSEDLSSRYLGQSITELEDLITGANEEKGLMIPFPQEFLIKAFPDAMSMGLIPRLIISKTQIVGIIDAARNIILEWSLRLEKDGILGEALTFTKDEKQIASSNTYNIQNFSGIIGNVDSEHVQIGGYNTIRLELKRLGVSQKERNELEDILDSLKTVQKEEKPSLIKRGAEWLKRNGPLIGTLAEIIRSWLKT